MRNLHCLLSLVISFLLISDISAKALTSRYAALTNGTGAKQRRRRGTSGKLQNIQLAIFTDRSTTLITFAQDLCQRKDQGVIITKFQISLRLCSAEISRRTSLQNRPGFRNQLVVVWFQKTRLVGDQELDRGNGEFSGALPQPRDLGSELCH